jgi:hypothetical protein
MGGAVKLGSASRKLSDPERALASVVFGTTLPSWDRILLDDGLGIGDRPYTLDGPGFLVMIHIGPVAYPDCTSTAVWQFQRIDATFIHEMTHVWQYDKGYMVKLSSLWAQGPGSGYSYSTGQSWDDYNVEQQASLVEHWYAAGMSTRDDEFQYVDKVVRKGGANSFKTLAELKRIP